MKLLKTKKGFTLIELLVVIAIIGLLSAVVLASLNSARSKSKDASIKSQLAAIRVASELYFDNNLSSYGSPTVTAGTSCTQSTSFFTDTASVAAGIVKIESDNGTGTVSCNYTAGVAKWAITTPAASSGKFYCLDSIGKLSETAVVQTITDQACD